MSPEITVAENVSVRGLSRDQHCDRQLLARSGRSVIETILSFAREVFCSASSSFSGNLPSKCASEVPPCGRRLADRKPSAIRPPTAGTFLAMLEMLSLDPPDQSWIS